MLPLAHLTFWLDPYLLYLCHNLTFSPTTCSKISYLVNKGVGSTREPITQGSVPHPPTMSFFGFDATLPKDRHHQSNAPGFGATPDAFAGLSGRGGDYGDDTA